MRFEVRTATENAGNLCTWAWALQSAVARSVCADPVLARPEVG